MTTAPILVWLRKDLRLADHPALAKAAERGAAVVPVFILDEAADGRWAPGGASRWWLHHSLDQLARQIAKIGGQLVLRRGDTAEHLVQLASQLDAKAVHCSRSYEPAQVALEDSLIKKLSRRGVALKRFPGRLLREPEDMHTKEGRPYKVYTPFWWALSSNWVPSRPLPGVKKITQPGCRLKSDRLADWRLLPKHPDWAGGLKSQWQPGEDGARHRLGEFIENALAGYTPERNRPDRKGTSRLSPHLHFGEISPRQCWHGVAAAAAKDPGCDQGAETFLKEIVWREFSHHLLFHFSSLPEAPFRKDFAAFPWRTDEANLKRWQQGLTGYPIVDAGMRELWQTGWMHNRVRMIVASFLIKHLMIPWQRGEDWFWDTLVDADLANNAASWQWVAGCGADAAPYFRIFNPIKQGTTFDPDGTYVRRFVPEIAALASSHIHAPWLAPNSALAKAGVVLGETYPHPMVDHAAARGRALAAFQGLKSNS